MDEQVKARLIGATVLVVIAVALVPELLSGPKRDGQPAAGDAKRGTRTITIDLGGAVASGARVQPEPPKPEPARPPAARLPTVEAPGAAAEQGETAAETRVEPPVSTPTPPPATVAAGKPVEPPPVQAAPARTEPPVAAHPPVTVPKGTWSVQVGAFGSAESARKLVADLKQDNLPAYVAPLNRSGKTLHRVRVGPEPTRADADKLAARLKARGLPGTVVAAD